MATSNVNKLVRGNFNLKPLILNKSPTDIVNSYVQQLYKQIPDKYKNELFRPRTSVAPQPEKRLPLRFPFPIINQQKKAIRPNVYRTTQLTVGNNVLPAPKKILKSPNFKIYSSRRYSSASSSGASFVRESEERRKLSYKPANGMQVRTYAGTATASDFYSSVRVFNDVSKHAKCMEITSAICKDLMLVDKVLKEKIRLVKPKMAMRDTAQMSKSDLLEASFRGWNHPTLSTLNRIDLQSTAKEPVFTKQAIPEVVPTIYKTLQVSKQKISLESKPNLASKHGWLPRALRKENARHEVLNIPRYYETRPPSITAVNKENENEKVSDPRYYETKPASAKLFKKDRSSELSEKVSEPRYYKPRLAGAMSIKKESLSELNERGNASRYYEARPASARPAKKQSLSESNEKGSESRYYETRPSSARLVKKVSLNEFSEKESEPRYYGTRPASVKSVKTEGLSESNEKGSESRYYETKPSSARLVKKVSLNELSEKESEPRYNGLKSASSRPVKMASLAELNEKLTEPRYYEPRSTSARQIETESICEASEKLGEPQKHSSYGQSPADLVCRSRPQRSSRTLTARSLPRRGAAYESLRKS